MIVLIFIFFTNNYFNKIYFLEKCGLPIIKGKIIINRLKILNKIKTNCKEENDNILLNLIKIKKKISEENNYKFWSIYIHDLKYNNIKINYYNDLKDFKNIPDPNDYLIGIEIFYNEIQKKKNILKVNKVSKTKKIKLDYDKTYIYNNKNNIYNKSNIYNKTNVYKNKFNMKNKNYRDNSLKLKKHNYFKIINKNTSINLYNNLHLKINIQNKK